GRVARRRQRFSCHRGAAVVARDARRRRLCIHTAQGRTLAEWWPRASEPVPAQVTVSGASHITRHLVTRGKGDESWRTSSIGIGEYPGDTVRPSHHLRCKLAASLNRG